MPSALPVLSHKGERLCEIDSTDLRGLSCIHERLRLLSDAADTQCFAQVAMSKRVTQAIVGGDSFLIPNQGIGASPYSRSSLSSPYSLSSRPVGTEEDPGAVCPVTLMPDSSRVAMDYATGDLYVFYDDRRVTIGPGSGVFLPHVHTDVLIRGNESTRVVFVLTLTGKKLSLVLSPTETIDGVMNKILEQEAIPLDQQRLIFAGKQLDRERALDDYDVRDGSVLHLVLRLRGGMAHWTSSRSDYEMLYLKTFNERPDYGTVTLNVRLLDGRDVPLRVAADSSVDALKRTIVELERGECGPVMQVWCYPA
jgi:large subunit ribosomal protein L40e